MTFIDVTTPPEPEPEPTRRPRRERTKRESRKPRSRRPPTPPNNVDPGWIHRAASAAILKALADRRFDVGAISEDFLRAVPGTEDSPEPAELLSRILAHASWRIPGIRRLEKRLEGNDKRSGMGADLTALFIQLYVRNRDIIAVLARDFRTQRASGEHTPKEGQ